MHVHKVLVWAAVALYAGAGATTFVREPNSRGPSAVQAGFECLMRVTRSYFNSTQVSRTRNMVIMHSSNLSAPAADIEIMFLARMHAFIASNNWLGWGWHSNLNVKCAFLLRSVSHWFAVSSCASFRTVSRRSAWKRSIRMP